MISRQHRFHGYGSLRRVYQNGQTLRAPLLSLRYSLNDRRSQYRCAVVVSRKVNKSAVVRNRIRRRIYEAVRQSESKIAKPFDVVFIIYSDQIAELPNSKLNKLIKTQLAQAGIIPASKTSSGVI
jgi:ribonuclease P protein component